MGFVALFFAPPPEILKVFHTRYFTSVKISNIILKKAKPMRAQEKYKADLVQIKKKD